MINTPAQIVVISKLKESCGERIEEFNGEYTNML